MGTGNAPLCLSRKSLTSNCPSSGSVKLRVSSPARASTDVKTIAEKIAATHVARNNPLRRGRLCLVKRFAEPLRIPVRMVVTLCARWTSLPDSGFPRTNEMNMAFTTRNRHHDQCEKRIHWPDCFSKDGCVNSCGIEGSAHYARRVDAPHGFSPLDDSN